jgi:hypothetical protein
MSRVFLAIAVLALLTQCAETDPVRRLASAQVSTSAADAAAAAALISRHRAAHGLGPVSVDARLNEAATVQARAVAQTGTLSHGAFESRMASFGIGGAAAENLTAGSDTVGKAVARWTASPPPQQQSTDAGSTADRPGARRLPRPGLRALLGARVGAINAPVAAERAKGSGYTRTRPRLFHLAASPSK